MTDAESTVPASAVPEASATPAKPEVRSTAKRRRGRAGWIVAVVFAVFYAFDIFEALSNLVGVLQAYSDAGVALPTPALLTIIGQIAAPVVVFVLALWGTRRARSGSAVLVFLVGFAVVAVITLDLQSVFRSLVGF
ncbi:hypothetical protein [Subtercola lobariae]|uniref:Uncharacterized protein n=1 Tax=Subtercola lobariae TaxID=1588641 RepID=A0A917B229_9MICO|nr:hypothetical protein [Subtercola lobariae]GGF14582.1 hypothetical protein GCM10011399_05540 [Subtercola lobariae]